VLGRNCAASVHHRDLSGTAAREVATSTLSEAQQIVRAVAISTSLEIIPLAGLDGAALAALFQNEYSRSVFGR
jgi:hypothetical protein